MTGGISIALLTTAIGALVGIASFSLPFLVFAEILRKLLKTTRSKNKKQNKIVMLGRSIFKSIESKISETLINKEISHENFMTIINEEKKYRELKETIRMMNSERSDTGNINLIEGGKKK